MEISYSAIPEKQYDDSKTIDSSIIIVVPGEVITTESGFLKYSFFGIVIILEVMAFILMMGK